MRLELRPTTSADLYAVSRLEQPTEVSRHLATTGIAWHREVLADPANHHLLVLHDGRVAGFAVLVAGPRRSLELRRIVVRPELKGRGVGRALLRVTLAHARERGLRRIVLDVANGNARARKFYAANGFTDLDLPSPFVGFEVLRGYRVMSRTVGRAQPKSTS
ncbi:MAG: GNAT family N-acetyltransferase [Kineosporiaceae bacterium]